MHEIGPSNNSLFCIKFQFNAKSPLQPSDEGYNKNPDRNDMVDILVCVVSANALPMMKDDTLNKMNVITTAARDYGENNGSASMCVTGFCLRHSLCC